MVAIRGLTKNYGHTQVSPQPPQPAKLLLWRVDVMS